MGVNMSRSRGSLGMPKYIHLRFLQHANVSPVHLLIVMILIDASLSKVCIS